MPKYNHLIDNINTILENGRKQAVNSVNHILVQTYWEIGRQIVEYEQKGKEKAEYGSYLLKRLSEDLTTKYGKGFSIDTLEKIRRFYLLFQNSAPLRRKLSWRHYCLIMRIENSLARNFYLIETEKGSWSTREIDRQINSMLFERLALSKDKQGVIRLAKKVK